MLISRSCLAALVCQVGVAGVANASVLAHWSFDADFTDSSVNTNHLLANNGTPVVTSTAGDFVFGGGALDLDKSQNQWLDLTTEINFTDTDVWSVSFWAKRRAGTGAPTGMILGDNTTTDSFIWTPNNANVVQGLRFRPVGVGTGNSNDYPIGEDDGAYHHWVVVSDGLGDIRAYRDNVDLGTLTPAGGADFDIKTVGSGYTGTNQIFDGQLDEIYILDEALAENGVASLFNFNTLPAPGDNDGDGDIDDSDLGTSFANYTGPVGAAGGKNAAQGDTDGDGDVDDSDLGTSFAGYTGPLSPAAVPEPASLSVMALGAMVILRRRRA